MAVDSGITPGGWCALTIDAGATESTSVDLGGARPALLQMPGAWTAADLAVQALGQDGTTWYPMYDMLGNPMTVPVAASTIVRLDEIDWALVRRVRLVSSAAQSAERLLYLYAVED